METAEHGILDEILEFYRGYYDVSIEEKKELPLYAKADFHQVNEKYVLSRKANLWRAQVHEYVYFFEMDCLEREMFERCLNFAHRDGMQKIEPGPEHMYSYITVVFVCNRAEADAIKAAKRCRIHKDFKWSFHGWMDVKTAVLNKGEGTVVTNRCGKDLTKLFHKFLQSKPKDKK